MIRPRDTDRYGRTVADVMLLDGRSLNKEMVAHGYAWWYKQYSPKDVELAQLERQAKDAGLGLWSQPDPIPPWEWRKGGGVPETAGVIGNRNSHIYHRPGCPNGAKIAEKNRVAFDSPADAVAVGYRPGKDCHKE